MRNNQEYAYNAQEKLKQEKINYENQVSQLTKSFNEQVEKVNTENQKLKKLLNEVHISEEDKGNEVKMVRANLIEEIFRVQNVHQKNEDELRKDNDLLSVRYSESIRTFKDTLKKAEQDNQMLRQKIEGIIVENTESEADLLFQINDLHRTNTKLVKALEDKFKENANMKSKADLIVHKSDHFSSFDRDEFENADTTIDQVIASSNKTLETLERQLKEKSTKWKKEKEKLLDEIEKRENIYAEKLALRDMELEKARNTFNRQLRLEETKNQTLGKENKILDKSLKGKYFHLNL